jgi:hypothetical protein
MCSRAVTLETVREPSAHGLDAELDPLLEQVLEVIHPRTAVEADHVQVHAVSALEIGGGKQVRHQLHRVDAVGARHDHQARRILVVGFIAQVLDHGQLLLLHLLRDLLDDLGARHLIRQRRDDNGAVLAFPFGPGTDRTVAGFVHRSDFALWRDDLGFGRIVRTLDVLEQILESGVRLFEQVHASGGHLAHVVRRDVGGHADGDAGSAVQQHVRQTRRHDLRFLQRAVEIGRPVDRAVFEFGQQDLREAREPRLGVAHGGERLGIVGRTPVALAVDQRITVAERLGHEHHSLVTGGVAVRVEFAEHVAHGARRFLVLGGGVEAQFRHGIDDAPLHGFQTVTDVRQRAVENDVHGIIQVRLFGEGR